MSYEQVLDLTVNQIAALMTKESLPPGQVDPETYKQFVKAL